MTGVETTLLIVLGVGFGILLLLSIMVVFIIVRILQNIQHITQKAQDTTDNFSEVLKVFGKKVAPIAVSTLVGAIAKKLKQRANAREEDV